MRTSTIAAQRESVRVLNLSAVRDLIQDAVEDALRESGRLLDESELKDLIEESEQGFQQRLAEFEHEKADLQSRIQGLSTRFERAQELLDKERNREVDRERFALSKDALGELEGTFGRIIDDAVASSEIGASFELELRVVMERCLDSERERVRNLEEKARSENIDLLERKIQRLASSLDEARSDRDQALETVRRAESRDSRGPSAGAIDAVQPSAADDPQAQTRRALLMDLMQENRDLRQKLNADNKKLKVTEKGQA